MAVNEAGSGQGSIFRGQGRDGRERVGFGGSELWGVRGWGSGPTPVFLPGEFHGQRSLVCCIVHGSQRVRHN